jgi:nitroreductase
MDALDAIRTRRSIGRLTDPAPDDDQLTAILGAAASAPDHGTLRPWRFTVLSGQGKDDFGLVLERAYLERCRETGRTPEPSKQEKERTKLGRAPMVVVVACAYQPSEKVPRLEQYGAVASATENACIAATALGFASMWRTGAPADDPRVKEALGLQPDDEIVGFLYLGSVLEGGDKKPHDPALDGLVHHWSAP